MVEIRLRPRRIIRVLVGISITLVALHGIVWGAVFLLGANPEAFGVELFDLDHERNIPTLFSSLLLMGCAGLWAAGGLAYHRAGEPAGAWLGLGALFIFLAIDETAGLHEALVPSLRAWLHASGLLRPTWVLVYGAGILVLAAFFWRWFWRLPGPLRGQFLLAAALYFSGALVIEMLGGLKHSLWADDSPPLTCLLCAFEEGLEMAGLIVLAQALLGHLQARGGVCLHLAPE